MDCAFKTSRDISIESLQYVPCFFPILSRANYCYPTIFPFLCASLSLSLCTAFPSHFRTISVLCADVSSLLFHRRQFAIVPCAVIVTVPLPLFCCCCFGVVLCAVVAAVLCFLCVCHCSVFLVCFVSPPRQEEDLIQQNMKAHLPCYFNAYYIVLVFKLAKFPLNCR